MVYTARKLSQFSNGYSDSKPNSDEQQNNTKRLRRLLRGGQDTELQQISMLDGDKSRQSK